VARPQLAVVQVGSPVLEPLAVTDDRVGRDHHPRAGQMGPPAQLDVVTVEADRRIEPAERPEQVGPHEQAGRRQDEHVAHGVVLLLIELAGLDDRIGLAEAVESEPDVLQPSRIVPVDELRADHAGVRAVELGDHGAHGVGSRSDVVVTDEEEPVVTLDEPQHLVGDGAESGIAVDGTHEGAREAAADPLGDDLQVLAAGGGHDEEVPQVRVVLGGEGCDGLVEPVARIVDDDDGHHRGRQLGVRLHEGTRLPVPFPARPSSAVARGGERVAAQRRGPLAIASGLR
jgi:hypothetical protein